MRSSTAPVGTRRLALVAVTFALVTALVAACSGAASVETASMRSQERPGGGTSTSDRPAEPTDRGDSSGSGGSSGPGGGDERGGGSEGRGPGGGGPDEFCATLREVSEQTDVQDVQQVVGMLRELRDQAPGELTRHFDVMIGMIERLENIDEEDPEALGELFEALMDPAVKEAGDAVGRYAADHCGLDLNGGIDLQPGVVPGG